MTPWKSRSTHGKPGNWLTLSPDGLDTITIICFQNRQCIALAGVSNYPLPAFHFSVEWDGQKLGFAEVFGLTIEIQAIEYRDGTSPEYGPIKMPGIPKYNNITLKRGIAARDSEFFNWLTKTKLNKQPDRRDIIIQLLNEEHEPVMTWKAVNACPVKIEGPGLNATGNKVAIESIEIAHEKLTIENG